MKSAWGRRFAPVFVALLVGVLSGCDAGSASTDPAVIRVACAWPRRDREAAARGFATPIVWRDWDDSADLVDVYLGGPASVYEDLATRGRLEPLDAGRYWSEARRSAVGWTSKSPSRTALDDPRIAPLTRAWALGRLRADGWPVAYAKLLAAYGNARTVGWRPGSALAAVASGEADATVDRLDRAQADLSDSVVVQEYAAIRRGARRIESARAFVRSLNERATMEGGNAEATSGVSPAAEDLAADLLGATLVDAQDELRRAVAGVDRAGASDQTVSRLTVLPPWPPASVEKLLSKGGEEGAALVETLTAQLAPEPGGRLWLAQSWLRPRAPIDGAFLTELAEADHGRLAREPRFRAWLRAEWTQWARQRYRWVSTLTSMGAARISFKSTGSSEP